MISARASIPVLFMLLLACSGLGNAQAETTVEGALVRFNRNSQGEWSARGAVNGQAATFVLDVEHSHTVLNEREVKRLGLHPRRGAPLPLYRPSGSRWASPVELDVVRLGTLVRAAVPALVIADPAPSSIRLGMGFFAGLRLVEKHAALWVVPARSPMP